jgi:hypothetical protein
MFLYVLQLFEVEYREDILLGLTSVGIKQATVVEGTNLDKMLERQFPLFAELLRSPEDRERFSELIIGLVEEEQAIDNLVTVLKDAGIDNREHRIYQLILIPGRQKG